MQSDSRKQYNLKKIPYRIIQYGIILYVLSMFLVFPLYYQNKYYNMGEAKYDFFKYATMVLFAFVAGVGLIGCLLNLKEIRITGILKRISQTDSFVLLYMLVVCISFALTPYKEEALWGYSGWYVGFLSQMAFVLLYFLVSRFFRKRLWFLNAVCVTSAIVFLLAILHRFQIDPLHLYDDLDIYYKIMFLSTIGQATWYSSFLCVVFPIGLFLYWNCNRKREQVLYGLYVFIGFATMVTQNSDSAFIAFALILLVLFCFSFHTTKAMKRFLEVLIIGLAACNVMGVLQRTFPDKVVPLEPLSIFASQSSAVLVLLVGLLLCYFLFWYADARGRIAIASFRGVPKIALVVTALTVMVSVGCVYLATIGKLPGFLSFIGEIEYFNFNDEWGNGRGFTWKYAADMFKEYPFVMKLFGCGPDSFASYSYEFYAAELSSKWGNSVLTNAHNEWFTSLLVFGIFGMVSYLGIFVSEVLHSIKEAKEAPFLIVVIMSIAAYIGHNFFCYQQIVCTPLIFMIMGMGEGTIRRVKEKRRKIQGE